MLFGRVGASRLIAGAHGAGLSVALLGVLVLIGWATRLAILKSVHGGLASMKPNSALCLVLAGCGLSLLGRTAPAARAAGLAAGAAIAVIAVATLAQHATGVDLHIDEAFFEDPDTPGPLHPGRMAIATATGFLFIGACLLLWPLVDRHRAAARVWGRLAWGVCGIGALAVVGYVFDATFLYTWYAFGSVSLHGAIAFLVLGAGLLAMRQATGAATPVSDEVSIVRTAAALLVLCALVTGISGMAVLEGEVERLVVDDLRNLLGEQVGQVLLSLDLRANRSGIVASRPELRSALRHIAARPREQGLRQEARESLESFRPYGFSALVLALADGEEAARSGTRIVGPVIAAPVGGEGGHGTLLWHEGQFYLQHEVPVTDGQERLGSLIAQQPLDALGRALTGNPTSYATAEFLLCSTAAAVLSCFPSRLSPTPVWLTENGQGSAMFARQARATGRGAGRAIDHRGRRVISAYTVVAGHQLAASLTIDLDEALAPLRRQLAFAFVLVAAVTGAGVLLIRHKVRPLAARLETAVRQRTAQLEEAGERLSESEAQVSAVVESAMDAMVTVGEDQRVVMFNAAAEKMFGCSAAEARGQPLERFIPERFRAQHPQHILYFGRMGTSARLMVERGTPILALHADGREFPVEATISQAIVKGRTLFTAVMRDVTERRRAEEAQRLFSERLQVLHRSRSLHSFGRYEGGDRPGGARQRGGLAQAAPGVRRGVRPVQPDRLVAGRVWTQLRGHGRRSESFRSS